MAFVTIVGALGVISGGLILISLKYKEKKDKEKKDKKTNKKYI